ncbi:hypothetical protein BCV70DRAFT_9341 [Testicularia cyperi]|uniref:Uncharacterized protein n=1 Tax=Testicularia cyperi TaxID=1882483 RepID=A0A317XXE9_9BASI|nr:hypothetical protein BCV70DRAFT_9341 [Testicularia cyperi]
MNVEDQNLKPQGFLRPCSTGLARLALKRGASVVAAPADFAAGGLDHDRMQPEAQSFGLSGVPSFAFPTSVRSNSTTNLVGHLSSFNPDLYFRRDLVRTLGHVLTQHGPNTRRGAPPSPSTPVSCAHTGIKCICKSDVASHRAVVTVSPAQ